MAVALGGDSCAACGVRLAADQRYCVECGQPRVPSRMPAFAAAGAPPADGQLEGPPSGAPVPASPTTWRSPGWRAPNATVFAVIGALLLAMGVGVLIGRSDAGGSSSSGTPRAVTVVLSGSGASAAAAAPSSTPTPAGTTSGQGANPPAAAAAAAAAASAKHPAAAKPAQAAKTPLPKPVHVGSTGSGPGYQKGKFTGNFFGGG